MANNHVFECLAASWGSTLVARSEVGRFTGGLLNSRSLANLDSQGRGPAGRFRVGRKVCYPIDSLIEWLQERVEPIQPNGRNS